MVHLDLFSGIGGFSYAADQVWDNVEHTFVEVDPFCQQVLRKHWPESEIIGDIKTVTDTSLKRTWMEKSRASSQRRNTRQKPKREVVRQRDRQTDAKGAQSSLNPFLLTGGFPCQPFSAAGVRRGTSDERYLWPEMLRVIRLAKPQWVIAENVRGLLTWEDGLVFEQICTDLESESYQVQPFIIPAVAVNAPHRRDRIWWVARHTEHAGEFEAKKTKKDSSNQSENEARSELLVDESKRDGSLRTKKARRYTPNAKNPISQRTRGRGEDSRQILERQSPKVQDERPSWESDWLEVATQFCSVDDGLPVELDGFKLSKSRHRAEQLKAYGNAIVPQVAIKIMKGIKYDPTK